MLRSWQGEPQPLRLPYRLLRSIHRGAALLQQLGHKKRAGKVRSCPAELGGRADSMDDVAEAFDWVGILKRSAFFFIGSHFRLVGL